MFPFPSETKIGFGPTITITLSTLLCNIKRTLSINISFSILISQKREKNIKKTIV